MAGVRKTHSVQFKTKLEIIPQSFAGKKDKQPADQQTLIEQLYQQIGQLTVECEFLKKSLRDRKSVV